MTGSDEYPADLAVGVTSSRVALLSAAARSVHQVILRAFADTGQALGPAALAAAIPSDHDLPVLLAELHDNDVVRLDAGGLIRAAYPFSAVPTAHTVSISGGADVYAMCAVDALGMADMLRTAVAVTSADPVTGDPIRVLVDHGRTVWSPDTAVVYVGATRPAAGGVAAADRCCTVMNFFTDPDTARQWMEGHPQVSGVVLTQGQALRLGVDIFGHLLHDD